MSKATLTDITTSHASVNSLNDNFQAIEEGFDNTISRDGSAPNEMKANIDMNNNEIINIAAPTSDSSAARWGDIREVTSVDISPSILTGDAGKVLTVNQGEDGAVWVESEEIPFLSEIDKGRILKVNNSGTVVSWEDKDIINVKDLGAIGDGVADDTSIIQSAILTQKNKGGGKVYIPSGVYKITTPLMLHNASGVSIIGDGGGWGKFTNKTTFTAPTMLKAEASIGGIFSIKTHQDSDYISNSIEIEGIGLNCNDLATNGIWIQSISGSQFTDITIIDSISHGIHLSCLDDELTYDAADNQGNYFHNITIVTEQGNCILLGGNNGNSSTRGANTSLNHFENIHLNIRDNDGFVFGYSDGNTLTSLFTFRPSGNIGKGLVFLGDDTSNGLHTRHNICYNIQTAQAGVLAQAGTSSSSSNNCIIGFNLGNTGINNPPEIEDGAELSYISPDLIKYLAGKHVCVDGVNDTALHANAQTQINNMGTESIRVFNGSSNHMRILTDTAEWTIRIDSSSGDLDIIRTSGSGKLSIPGTGQLEIGYKPVTYGSVDSGGAGYKVLRVPN